MVRILRLLTAIAVLFVSGSIFGQTVTTFIWDDLNGNGIQDGGEPGIPGQAANVQLWDFATGMNSGLAATPLGGGMYQFSGITPGTYYLLFTTPGGYVLTDFNADGNNNEATDTDTDSDVDPATGTTYTFVVTGVSAHTNADAGFFLPASIGDFVWHDVNANGIQNGGEPGLPAGTVSISITDNLGNPVNDANGNPVVSPINNGAGGTYMFSNLAPGDYRLTFNPVNPAYYRSLFNQDGADTEATDTNTDSDANRMTGQTRIFTLISNEMQTNLDAGFVQGATISDFVWIDSNGNGLQDGGEPGLGGVQISITDDVGAPVNDLNGNPVGATVSNGAGAYSFMDLDPTIDYILTFVSPAAPMYFLTTQNAAGGATDATDANNDSDANQMNGMTHIVMLDSDETEIGIDAGFYLPVSVGNLVWCDADGNGLFDGAETGAPGISITLLDDMGNPVTTDIMGNPLMNPMISNAAGAYSFMNLPPGTYQLQATLAAPYDSFTEQDQAGGPGDAADVDGDSDANMNTGITHQFSMDSGDAPKNILDIGVWYSHSIGGNLWRENVDNGLFDGIPPDQAGSNALVNLYQDLNDDGVAETLVDNTISDINGDYLFNDLAPGKYLVEVDRTNFNAGGSLELYVPSTFVSADPTAGDNENDGTLQPDNASRTITFMVMSCDMGWPGDNTGMELWIDFGFFLEFDCNAGNDFSQPNCNMVENDPFFPICDIFILDGFCAGMNTTNSPGPVPSPLCPTGGAPHNMSWFSFVAGTGNYTIEVTPGNCEPGTGGLLGIQLGLYTDCTFNEAVFCDPNCSTAPVSVNSNNLIPGETYYFFLDGCAGSICDYEVDVIGNFQQYQPQPPTQLLCDGGSQCLDVCPGAQVTYELADLDLGDLTYLWDLPAGGGYTVIDPNSPQNETDENNITIQFDQVGTYQICFNSAFGKCFSIPGGLCQTINVVEIPDEMFMAVEVCEDDFPYTIITSEDPNGDGVIGWQGPAAGGPDPMFTHTVVTPQGCQYDQIIEVIELPIPPTETVDTAACDNSFMYHGLNIVGSVMDLPYTLPFPASNGCDSNIILNAHVIIYDGVVELGPCLADGVQLNITTLAINPLNYDNITYTWFNSDNEEIGTGTDITVDQSDTYTVEVAVEKYGVVCTDEFSYDLDVDDLLPAAPTAVNWDLDICDSAAPISYTANSSEPGLLGFDWSWPADVDPGFVAGQGTQTLTIDWTGSMGGDLCVAVTTFCGTGEQVCMPVTVVTVPTPSFTVTPENCIDSVFVIEYDGPTVMNADYTWDFDGGSVVNGTSGVGPGPHEVVYATSGTYDISLMMEINNCPTEMVTNSLTAVDPPAPPNISCVPSLGSVTFSWNDITDATNYSVEVLSGQPSGSFMGSTSYVVDGLAEGESVTIQLTTETSTPCGDIVTTSLPCTSQDCTPPMVTVTSPQNNICLDGSTMPFDLETMIDPPSNGTGTFSGNGITDAAAGTFDPALANLGNNTINYTYEDEDGCFGSGQTTITVFATPVADFTVDNAVMCIEDEAMVEYTGTIQGGNYDWDFGVDAMTSGSGPGPFMVTWNSPGVKTISLTVDKDGCFSEEQTFEVTVEDVLAAPVITCVEQNTTFVTFGWSPVADATDYEVLIDGTSVGNQTGTMYTESGLMTGTMVTITVIANSANSCPSTTAMRTCVAENCPPTSLEFENDLTEICLEPATADILLEYTVVGGFMDGSGMGVWSGTGVSQNGTDYFFSPTTAGEGSFTVYLDYIEDVCPTRDSIRFDITETPVADFNALTAICVTDVLDLNYMGTVDPQAIINWDIEGTTVIDDGNGNYSAQWSAEGDYMIELTVTKGDCSSQTITSMVTVEPEIEAPVLNCAPSLNDVTISWNDVDCVSGYEIFVDNVSEGIITDSEFVVTGLSENEMVNVYVVAISQCLCTDATSVEIPCTAMACPDVTVDLQPAITSLCESEISGTITIDAVLQGDDGNGTVQWSGTGIDQNGEFDPAAAGIGMHTISYVYTQDGCTYPATTDIEIFENPTLTVEPTDPECYSELTGSITVNPAGGDGNYTLTLDGNVVTGPVLTDIAAGSHTIVVADGNGCEASQTTSIIIPGEPTVSISGPVLLIAGESGDYDIDLSDFDDNLVDSILWYNSEGDIICSGECLTISTSTVDPVTVCATVFFGNCFVEDCIDILSEKIQVLTFPNIFSPNDDGSNETFYLNTNDPAVIINSMRIYDRWGELIFLREDIQPGDPSQGWDGRYKGQDINPGVYIYVIEYIDEDLEPKIEVGDVTLIR